MQRWPFRLKPIRVKLNEGNPARIIGGAGYPAATIPLLCPRPGRDGDHLPKKCPSLPPQHLQAHLKASPATLAFAFPQVLM